MAGSGVGKCAGHERCNDSTRVAKQKNTWQGYVGPQEMNRHYIDESLILCTLLARQIPAPIVR